MKKQPKKLTLNKETLRDLTPQNAGAVKGGTNACTRTCYCTYTCKHCATEGNYCHYTKGHACHYTKGKPCH